MVIKHKLKSDLKIIPKVTLEIFKELKTRGIDEDVLFDVRLCLEEALINAVKHGNKMDKNKKVSLRVAVLAKKIEIEVSDEGQGFDYRHIPSPVDAKNIERTCGRGIFLIKKLMDKFKFSSGGSRIRMIKYIRHE
jgi:serine/threonine-protein kinase RsbW